MRSDSAVTEKGSEGVPEHPKARLSEEQEALGCEDSAEDALAGLSAKARGKLPARWNSKLPDRLMQSLEEEPAGAGSSVEPETQQGRDTDFVKRWVRDNRASMRSERAQPGPVESDQRVEPEQRAERAERRAGLDVAEEGHEDASAGLSEREMGQLGPAEQHAEPEQHMEFQDAPRDLLEGPERPDPGHISAEHYTEPAHHAESEDVPPESLKRPKCLESEHIPAERYTELPPQTGSRGQLERMESVIPMEPEPERDENPEQPPETQDNQAQVNSTTTEPEQPGEDSSGGPSIDANMAVDRDMLEEQRMSEYYADLHQDAACEESEGPGGDMTPEDF
jgi:hypothetical protein